ncbi:putative Na+/H+ antiporter [Chitinasiproducens palmae]|uniref:Na+/H+ antiporter n=1 Tax=Chitinasiproducens palmae TaxID=1770053 RepID=A0A1H2PUA4_9BURK|nr:putative Na+/H+ antiporter [Chitinasiproducens palmae]SDV50375.1 Putative Na+/H+ antiporter [Chitinasiproducens palmae]
MPASPLHLAAAIVFACALLHTFLAKPIGRLADRWPRHAGLFHFLGEVEVVFGLWALVLAVTMCALAGVSAALSYLETRHYTEPMFVFVVMTIAASRPIGQVTASVIDGIARLLPGDRAVWTVWLGLSAVPLLGSAITEPAAMTLAALMLRERLFVPTLPERLKYLALGVLFVNVSIGGTLTAFAAPPILMVARAWQWDSTLVAGMLGWKAALAVVCNASMATALLAPRLRARPTPMQASGGTVAAAPPAPVSTTGDAMRRPAPAAVVVVHVLFLVLVVASAHHPAIFIGLFLFFLGYTEAYARHQSPLLLRESLLVAFFLAGLVVLGGQQQWWLQPLVARLDAAALFFGALGLTAITDNAAITYLGSLIPNLSAHSRYMLVAGAVAGGGLTVIANAPNPAGVALLRGGFRNASIGFGGLLLGALPPTLVATAAFLLL